MKKQQQQQQPNQSKQNDVSVTVPIPSTLAQQNNSKNSDESAVVQDKRPSWRLRVDNGSKVIFNKHTGKQIYKLFCNQFC